MTRNIVSAETEDGEMYAYIYSPEYSTQVKRLVMADAWNKELSLLLCDAKAICQKIVDMEIAEMQQKEQRQNLDFSVRWAIRRDMTSMLAIESESFDDPWNEDNFIAQLRQRNSIALVAETKDDRVVGYVIYELMKNRIDIVNLAAGSEFRRAGVATRLVDALKQKLSPERRVRLSLEIRESNLVGQLFFKSCGFLANRIVKDHWDTGEDGYVMQYRYREESRVATI